MKIDYFEKLADISLEDAPAFGGKSASLGEMMRLGVAVPNGFAVSIETQKAFSNKPFPGALIKEMHGLFEALGLERVAVRSSAIAEDGTAASWAGQLESYLNVSFDGVEQAIRDCWKSIGSAHAVEYAKDKRLNQSDLLVGVTVQTMVDSEVAGVMFTINPISGNKNQLIIEGLYGLGEMLVQGIVTPDRFTIDKSPLRVTKFDIEIKSKKMIFESNKNRVVQLAMEVGDKAVLRENQVLELAKIGLAVEKHYGQPIDIEWAYKGGQFYIVQARPVTNVTNPKL